MQPGHNLFLRVFSIVAMLCGAVFADEPAKGTWKYSPELLRPFWKGDVMEGESVLFIKDSASGEARASVLFPVQQVLAVRPDGGKSGMSLRPDW